MTIQKIAVLTSGGDAPGMNAAVRAVTRKGIFHELEIYGIYHGYEGLLRRDIRRMELGSVADIIHRGGTMLQTARCLAMLTDEGQAEAAAALRERGITGLVVIGGDGSYRGAQSLAQRGVNVVGVPGTIDNDILGTELTIGFDTAVNTVIEAVSKLRDTASSHERAFIVEVMGRNCGDIALRSGLGIGAETIIIPEVPYDLNEIGQKIQRGIKRGKNHSIIIVAEGAGDAREIGERLHEIAGVESRVTILGHVQRGGSPSAADAVLATRMGARAVEALLDGESEVMVAAWHNEIILRPLSLAFAERPPFDEDIYKLADQLAI
ncbi:MAG: 6-phosphofructokinase [Gracilibacteraceae bacterium]|jgi:6-phosphofructokinase 1|nr:6-phosphofructokinase [Gracilibacteraceae bacterium]